MFSTSKNIVKPPDTVLWTTSRLTVEYRAVCTDGSPQWKGQVTQDNSNFVASPVISIQWHRTDEFQRRSTNHCTRARSLVTVRNQLEARVAKGSTKHRYVRIFSVRRGFRFSQNWEKSCATKFDGGSCIIFRCLGANTRFDRVRQPVLAMSHVARPYVFGQERLYPDVTRAEHSNAAASASMAVDSWHDSPTEKRKKKKGKDNR